jgi:hypothetical protein
VSEPSSISKSGAEPPRRSVGRWFWGGFFAVLLLGLAFSILAFIRGGAAWLEEKLDESKLPPVFAEAVRVTLAPGESVYLDAAALASTRMRVLAELDERRAAAEAGLERAIDQGLEQTFNAAEGQIPAFADWYYSLTGEYTRLFNAALGNLATFLAERLDELVFAPAGTTEAIDALGARLGEASVAQVDAAVDEVRDLLLGLVRASGLPADQVRVSGEWELGERLGSRLEPFVALSPEDIARQGIAASAGAAAGAVTAKKLGSAAVAKAATKLAAKPSVGAASALVAKLGLKSAAKAGGALGAAGGGAATGAVLCAGTVAGAPLSPACALVGGAVSGVTAWLLVDKAVIEADEYLNRDAFEAELRAALAEQRAALRAELVARYVAGTGAVLQRLRSELETELAPRSIEPKKDFVPATAADRDQWD